MALPIDTVLPDLLATLAERPAAVLQAPPGAGKTTRVPLALLDQPWLQGRRIVMLEPRRLAARSAARFMAAQLRESVGETVGYRVRLDSRVGPKTRIEVVTEGVLVRMLQDDPALEGYGAVLFDEFHERSLFADLGLALALESQQALRPDLRLLVMSATLDAGPVASLLGDAPTLTSEGRSFPVEVRYRPLGRDADAPQWAAAVLSALREEQGSALVFLPGVAEIRRLQAVLADRLPGDIMLAPLYGDLTPAEQDAAIAPAAAGRRKLVLATSIAETSLTIEGVRIVIDSGLMRRPRFDPNSGMSRLETQRVSLAAAEQRRGRAGRLEPGSCYRLWSESEQRSLAPYTAPEILEADLAGLVLELARWGVRDPLQLQWLDPPPAAAWAQARELLQDLQALDVNGAITPHGHEVLNFGLHPRLGHMVLKGRQLGWGRMAAELAALLSERDILSGGAGRQADLHLRLEALRRGERGRAQRVRALAQQLLPASGAKAQWETADALGVLLGFAYPERIAARRSGSQARYLLANGRGAWLSEEDPLRNEEFLVAAALDGKAREARIQLAAPIARVSLETYFADADEEQAFVAWDDDAGAVSARRQRRYGALVLEDRPLDDPDAHAVASALAEGLRRRGLQVLPWGKATRQWQARVLFLRRVEGECWPDISDAALLRSLQDWFVPFASGITRLAQLKDFPLQTALEAMLDYDLQQRLAREAPTHLQVPSGSRIALDYEGENPVLAVKLQEMFGAADTPRIAGGRVPVTLHLLSPAQRPVQVTQDLAGFWRHGYFEVRKDLRGRYPKHPWPDDPMSAEPTRRTKQKA